MSQYGRPDSDITTTGRAGGTYAAIDESSPVDTPYGSEFVYGNENAAVTWEFGLSNVTDPGVHTGHTFRYRIVALNGTTPSASAAVYCTASLYQGTTLIKADSQKTTTSSWTTYSLTLSEAEAANISDYTDLRLRFVSPASGGSAASQRALGLSWAELEVPDASGTQYSQSAAGSPSSAGAQARQTGKAISGALGLGGSLARLVARMVAGALSSAGTLAADKSGGETPGTVEVQVGASSSDGVEAVGASPVLTDTYVYFGGGTSSTVRTVGLHFDGISIPAGATITEAYLSLYVYSGSADDVNTTIYGQDAAEPGTFTTTDANIDGRTKTTASVSWVQSDVLGGGAAAWVNSPSIVDIIEELLGSYSSYADGSMVFFFTPAADQAESGSARTYDESSTLGAKLHIEYTTSGTTYMQSAGGALSSAGGLARRAAKAITGMLASGSSSTYTDGYGGDINTAQGVNLREPGDTPARGWYNGGAHNAIQFGDYNNALLRFNLSALPASATVTSATLYLGTSGAGTANVYAVLPANAGWIEGVGNLDPALEDECCWNALASTGEDSEKVGWAGGANGCGVAGTDISSGTIGQLSASGAGVQAVTLDADTVEGWLGTTNPGLLIKPTATNSNYIWLDDYATASDRPKLVVQYIAYSPALVGVLAAVKAAGLYLQSVAGTLTSSGGMARRAGKVLAGGLSSAGAAVKQARRSFAGTLSSAGAALSQKISGIIYQSVGGTLATAGGMTRRAQKALAGAVSSAGAAVKQARRSFAGTLSTIGAGLAAKVGGIVSQSVGGALSLAGASARQTRKQLSGSLSLVGSLGRMIGKAIAAVLSWLGGLERVKPWGKSPAARTLQLEGEDRTMQLGEEGRVLCLGEEDRVLMVEE